MSRYQISRCILWIEHKPICSLKVKLTLYIFISYISIDQRVWMFLLSRHDMCYIMSLLTTPQSLITGNRAAPRQYSQWSRRGVISPPSSCQLGSNPPCPGCRQGWCHDHYCHHILLKHDSIVTTSLHMNIHICVPLTQHKDPVVECGPA